MFSSGSFSSNISCKSQKEVFGRTVPANLQKLHIILYSLLKMSKGQSLLDPELINVKTLDFTKPNSFSKTLDDMQPCQPISTSGSPSTSRRSWTQKNVIKENYALLLDKHEEPFKCIAKTTTDVSLMTIKAPIEDFKDIIKALPQTTKVTSPGRPKRFIEISISISAMAMSSFN